MCDRETMKQRRRAA